eukprot:gene41900-56742_t
MSNLIDLSSHFSSETSAIKYLIEIDVLKVPICCEMAMRNDPKLPKMFHCSFGRCTLKKSITKGTFFGNSRLTQQTGLNKNTITDWWQYCQELVAVTLQEHKIGGPGIVVEIDESKFGKRKHNTGKRVEGVWVLGGVERTEDRRTFAISVDNRNK